MFTLLHFPSGRANTCFHDDNADEQLEYLNSYNQSKILIASTYNETAQTKTSSTEKEP